jgi:hypothetical protein
MSHMSPSNGGFWLFYGVLAATTLIIVLAIVYGFAYIRPSDLDVIAKTRTESAATKKAFDTLVVGRTPEGFHRKDMREWCEEFERTNRGSGIICPDPYGLRGFREPR